MNSKVLIFLMLLSTLYLQAQKDRINALEDTFIQGGETASEIFGETKAQILRVAHSDKNSKYARITYLKFKMPKKFDDVENINLVINIKVFKKDELPEETLSLSVFLIDDKWSELSTSWDDALELKTEIAQINLPQTKADKAEEIIIELDINKVKTYLNENGRMLSIALASYNSRTSAVITSKDKSVKFGPHLMFE